MKIEIKMKIDIQINESCTTIFSKCEGPPSFRMKNFLIKVIALIKKFKTPGFIPLYL